MRNYEQFLKNFDKELSVLFEKHNKYIKCQKGCSYCCEKGDYPMSQLEFSYLTCGFLQLPTGKKFIVQRNINEIKRDLNNKTSKDFEHKCPFLIDKECCVYEFRPIICRTFGICYYDEEKNYVRLPDCVNYGLNYSKYYDKDSGILTIEDMIKTNLRIDKVFESEQAKKYGLETTEIRPMLSWIFPNST